MAAVDTHEVAPGLVVQLDTEKLRALGGCETNAVRTPQDRAVVGAQFFLVLSSDGTLVTTVPLFAHWVTGNHLLEEQKKGGAHARWREKKRFFSCWQFWRIPLRAFHEASENEDSETINRRWYARGNDAALLEISAWQKKNRVGFSAV